MITLIVNGEGSRHVISQTMKRMADEGCTEQQFRAEFAALTLGSGAVAMVLSRTDLAPEGHRYLRSVSQAATEWSHLCRGTTEQMFTDTRTLLVEGLKLARQTWDRAWKLFDWSVDRFDQFVLPISVAHGLPCATLGIDSERCYKIYPEWGNVGPAAVDVEHGGRGGADQEGRPGRAAGDRLRAELFDERANLVSESDDMVAQLMPYRAHYLGDEGRRQHFLDEGDGPPVVMVHGNPTWCFYYRNLVGRLRDRFRCIVPDHIGCGRSDAPKDSDYGYTLEDRVDDLERLLDERVPEGPIDLVVHDWGGMIGWPGLCHPHHVRRFLPTAGFRLPDDKLPRAIASARPRRAVADRAL